MISNASMPVARPPSTAMSAALSRTGRSATSNIAGSSVRKRRTMMSVRTPITGLTEATFGHSHGSQSLVARGVGVAANASGAPTLLAAAGVYLLIWRRRERLRAAAPDQALAVLALILALMTFGKVLSPQYFIWTLPAWALVAARDRTLAVLGGFTLLLTQVEYPALYIRFVHMQPESVAIVVARNTLLVVTFAVAAWRLWSLSEAPASLFTDRSL